MKKFVYVDNAATTKVSKNVIEHMVPFLENEYGNPSSIYSIGRSAKIAIEQARDKVAKALGAD